MAQILPPPSSLPAFSFAPTAMDSEDFAAMESHQHHSRGQSSHFPSSNVRSGIRPLSTASVDPMKNQDAVAGQSVSSQSRHARKPKSVALPSFSFNPGEPTDSSASPNIPTDLPPSDSLQSSPKGGRRHRRIASEYIGDSISQPPPVINNPPPEKPASESHEEAASLPSTAASTRKGHRHRRSAALFSQDLSSAARRTAGEALKDRNNASGLTHSPKSSIANNHLEISRSASFKRFHPSPPGSKTPSPSRVSFVDKVDVIPENSESRIESKPSQPSFSRVGRDSFTLSRPRSADSTSRPLRLLPTADSTWAKDDLDLSRQSKAAHSKLPRRNVEPKDSKLSMAGEHVADTAQASALNWSFPTLEEQSASQLCEAEDDMVAPRDEEDFKFPTSQGSVRLSGNFDLDPTATMVSEEPEAISTLAPRYSEDSSKPPITGENDDAVMDIDAEMEEEDSTAPLTYEQSRSLRGKGFSSARKSMHSSGMTSGFTGPGMHYQRRTEFHRRAESAPSSLVTNSTRAELEKFKESSASQKGFEMSNVFEEDEDDSSPPPPKHIKGNSSPALDSSRFRGNFSLSMTDGRNKSALASPRSLEPSNASTKSQSQRSLSNTGTPTMDSTPSFSNGRHLDLPRMPLSRGPGTNSLPSLIDSQSTITDAHQRLTPSEASPVFPPPASADSNSSNSRWAEIRRKRSSVVSLSKLIGISSGSRSNLAIGQSNRCQTSDGLVPEQKQKKPKSKRVSGMLKFWKSKHLKKS